MRYVALAVLIVLFCSMSTASPLWSDIFDTSAVTSVGGNALTLDHNNNIYAVGTASGGGSYGYRWVVVRYLSNGNRHWAKIITPLAASLHNRVIDVCCDSTGVYVLGRAVLEESGYYVYLLMKLDSLGNQLWRATYDGAGYAINEPKSLAQFGDQIVVTGYAYSGPTHNDIATVVYSTSGAFQWSRRYSRLSNSDDRGSAVACDSSGNIYVTGTTRDFGPVTTTDAILIKYSSIGEELWDVTYDSPVHLSEGGTHVAVSNQDVLIAGFAGASDASSDYLLMNYLSDGTLSWSRTYSPDCECLFPGNCRDSVIALLVDSTGDIYTICNSRWSDGGSGVADILVMKYSPQGVPDWIQTYSRTSTSKESAAAGVLSNGYLHFLARTGDIDEMMLLVGFDWTGSVIRQEVWVSPSSKPVGVADLISDPDGSLAMLGSIETTSYLNHALVTLKYAARCCTGAAGDVSASNGIDLTDLSMIIAGLTMQPSPSLPCPPASDLNGSGVTDLTDLSTMIAYLTLMLKPALADCIAPGAN